MEVGWLSTLTMQGAATVYSGGSMQVDTVDNTGSPNSSGGSGGSLDVSGTATVQSGGTLAMHGFDGGGKDVAVVEAGGALNVDGTVDVDWDATLEVYGSVTVGGGEFQMGNPATYLPGTVGDTLTIYSGGTFSIDATGTFAMMGFDAGGSDVAVVEAGGALNVDGTVDVDWDATLEVYGSVTVGGGEFQMGNPATYLPGTVGDTLTIYSGGTFSIDATGTFAMRGFDGGGQDVAVVEAGGALNVDGTVDVDWDATLEVYGSVTVGGGEFQMGNPATYLPGTVGDTLTIYSGGTFSIDATGTFAMRGFDAGGKDVAVVEAGGALNMDGTMDVDWDATLEVYGSVTVDGGEFQMGNPATYLPGTVGDTLTIYSGGTFSIDATGTFAMKGFDAGGRDVAVVEAGGDFIDLGSTLVGWNSSFDLQGTADVASGAIFQVGDLGFAGYVQGDPGASFTVASAGVMGVDAGGQFQVGQNGMGCGGHDEALVDQGGTFNLSGSAVVENGDIFQDNGTLDPPPGGTLHIEDTSRLIVGSSGSFTVGTLLLSDSGTATVHGTLTVPAGGCLIVTESGRLITQGAVAVKIQGTELTWAVPAFISAGTPLGAAQLNAAANVPGTFCYTLANGRTPAWGAVLPLGSGQVLEMTFTPTKPAYPAVSASVTVTVRPAQPSTLAFTTPPSASPIQAGVRLGLIVVQLEDQWGNAVCQAGVAVTLSLVTLTGSQGSFASGPMVTVITDSNGQAIFNGDLVINCSGSYQLVASTNLVGVAKKKSNPITVIPNVCVTRNRYRGGC